MTSTETLTSLAILKVNIDRGGDYLEYLRPFVLQVLVDHKPDPVTAKTVNEHILDQFGLAIPERTIQIVLQRVSKKGYLKKNSGLYYISGELPDPGIATKRSEAKRHIDAVMADLMEFSSGTLNPLSTRDRAEAAILAFLTTFNISCLRAYLQATVIPGPPGQHNPDIVLVSNYVTHLQSSNPERFESFMIVVQGHMLANALLCPDLDHVSKNYRQVRFYLDTPLLAQCIGLEGEHGQNATKELMRLLHNLGAAICAFSHSRDELKNVLRGAAANLELNGRGLIVMEARRRGTTKSDLLLLAEQLDDRLAEIGIVVQSTPRYIQHLQIDEEMFEQLLRTEVSYRNPRAAQYDINSVRSIYALREGISPASLEKSRAVLVTSNAGFSQAAWHYGQKYDESKEVSSVITDFSLANMAWLKAPMGAPAIPAVQVLSLAYAALQPSVELLGRYMEEINKLEQLGMISSRDHQLLRSSPQVYDELVTLTLGDESALTEETVTETLRRVSAEIKREEAEKLTTEEEAHRTTQEKLMEARKRNQRIQQRIYWQCHRKSKKYANVLAGIVGLLLIGDMVAGLALLVLDGSLMILVVVSPIIAVVGVLTLISRWFGISVMGIRQRVQDWMLGRFLKNQAKAMGVDMSDFTQ